MKTRRNALLLAGTLLGGLAASHASALTFNLDTVYTGFSPGGTAPWLTITITDVAADTVNVRVDHNSSSASGQFISSVYLNLNPFVGSITLSNEFNSNKRDGDIELAENGVNGAAGNLFDLGIEFKTTASGGGANRLKPGEFWSADFTGAGLSSSSFADVNNNGLDSGAHLQGIAGGLSSHITTSDPVPEPASMAALAIGAVALLRRRAR
jgi:hypothetical protein